MGAGNQGGGGNAEDAAIRRDATARGEDPSVTRRYFADRDSGKLAANAYLSSEAPGSGGQTNKDILERQLANQGLSLEGSNFVRYDDQGNRGTVGGINERGNFFGSADLSGVNSPSYLAQSAEGGSRDRRYGSNAEAMSQGTLDPRIQDSLIDLVTYNPTGTVTGMSSQQVYNPTSLFSGDPNRTFNMDTGLYETDESIGFDDTSPSLLGRAARGATDFIGQGGMMGAVTRGLGALSDDLGGGDKSSNLSDEVTSSGITNALMGGVNSVSNNPLTGFEPQVAGPFSGSAINPFINMNIDPTRMSQQGPNFTPPPVQFDASGKTVEERLLQAQKDRFGAVDDLSMDRLKTMRLRDRSNEAYDPKFYDAFGNEYNNAETARISDVINEADSQAAMQRQTQINSLGQRVPITDKPFYDCLLYTSPSPRD